MYERLELIGVIGDPDLTNKVVQLAKQNRIQYGAALPGRFRGTNAMLDLLELGDVRKEILLMVSESNRVSATLKDIIRDVKESRGMVFTTLIATKYNNEGGGGEDNMYNSIVVIVDKGKGNKVIDAANAAGALGGAIVNAKGIGLHETQKVFNMEIIPAKELIIVLSKSELTSDIITAIREQADLNKPEDGVIFVNYVDTLYGAMASGSP